MPDNCVVLGDSEDVSPTYYKDGDADVAGVPSGVSARPQQPHECAAAIAFTLNSNPWQLQNIPADAPKWPASAYECCAGCCVCRIEGPDQLLLFTGCLDWTVVYCAMLLWNRHIVRKKGNKSR